MKRWIMTAAIAVPLAAATAATAPVITSAAPAVTASTGHVHPNWYLHG